MMFDYHSNQFDTSPREIFIDPIATHRFEFQLASRLFHRQRMKGLLNRIWGLMTSRCNQLKQFNEVAEIVNHSGGHYKGVQPVEIDRIQGSESRSEDFDNQFHPLRESARERWTRISMLLMVGEPLPAVELIQVGDEYYVRDGHHRISAARALGYRHIDAVVTTWKPQSNSLPLAC